MKYILLILFAFSSTAFSVQQQNAVAQAGISSQQTYKIKVKAYSNGSLSAGRADNCIGIGPIVRCKTSKRVRDMFYTKIMGNATLEQREMVCKNTKRWGKYRYSFCKEFIKK